MVSLCNKFCHSNMLPDLIPLKQEFVGFDKSFSASFVQKDTNYPKCYSEECFFPGWRTTPCPIPNYTVCSSDNKVCTWSYHKQRQIVMTAFDKEYFQFKIDSKLLLQEWKIFSFENKFLHAQNIRISIVLVRIKTGIRYAFHSDASKSLLGEILPGVPTGPT